MPTGQAEVQPHTVPLISRRLLPVAGQLEHPYLLQVRQFLPVYVEHSLHVVSKYYVDVHVDLNSHAPFPSD